MHARVNTVSGATDVDAGLAYLANATGDLAQMKGYLGLVATGNRAAGRVSVLSLWDTLDDLEASDGAVDKTRRGAVEAFGGEVTVEVFEVIISEIGPNPPELGCPELSRRGRTDAEHLEEALDYNRDVTAPLVRALPGFRSILGLVDRQRGEGIVGVIFDDMDSLVGARQSIEGQVFEGARSVGVRADDPEVGELLMDHRP
jgi:heme-degrading monooxygenase HmoA